MPLSSVAAHYHVGQHVAVARNGLLEVGTIAGAQLIRSAWRYRVCFGLDDWDWFDETDIAGVQGELPLDG